MNTIYRTLVLAAAAASMVSCGNKSGKTDTSLPSAAAPAAETLVKKITTSAAVLKDVPQEEVYSATVQANAVNNIAPQSGSRIQKINVEVGDFVSAGQVLAEMDRLNLEQSRLSLINDSTELFRLRSLYEEGGLSKSDLEAMELSYNVKKSQYRNLLENTVLRAPISGVISARNYDKGDMYGMGQPIYVLQQITPVKLLVGVSESDYTLVKRGQSASITVDAFPGEVFTGRVNRLYPTMDAQSHTFSVEVIVNNYDRRLRPGMYAKVTLSFGMNRSITVPDAAVVKQLGSGQRFVFVLGKDGTVKSTAVTVGRHMGTEYEILSGIGEGDVVAVRGSGNLRDGDKVEVIEG